MAKLKGYYNVNNGIFLGLMTATNEATGVMSTPRYVEGVCFGEYDTETEEFVPHTNPTIIKDTMVIDEDSNAFTQGRHEQTVTGVEEDKGLDIARKKISSVALGRTPNVETKTLDGKTYNDSHRVFEGVKKPLEKNKKITVTKESKFLTKEELPKVDFSNLF